ncbi:hypothetical protein KC19_8G115600 [Ceratodon purpureus]|uniref:Uncharacterized protein n=1 Tax=Ceratodon purpureus TaxID=3225 RepID=A0A8T0H2D2_CERPU|nr:hypothetical protein KC19_8G115600 [Ceratodon purpureus]
MNQRSDGRGKKRKTGETDMPPPIQRTPMEVEPSSQGETRYGFWIEGEIEMLLEWNTEKKNSKTFLSMSKKSIAGLISDYLRQHSMFKTPDQVLNKMRYIEDKYKDTKDFLNNTSEGLTSEEETRAITSINAKLKKLCPFYDTINRIMKDSVSKTPPYVGESGPSEDLSDMLFTDSALRGDLKSLEEEEGCEQEGPEDEVEANAGEEYEDDAPTQGTASTERTTEAPVQTPQPRANTAQQSARTPPQHPRTSIPTLTSKVRNVNKKPKSIAEQVADLQKESRLMLEKKLEVNFEHHKQKLEFLREQSQRQFKLNNRRLDLEFSKQENEKEEHELQRLWLQLELEKIMGSTQ